MCIYQWMGRILSMAILASLSSVSLADWEAQKVYVKKVEHFYSGGNSVVRVIYEFVPGISFKSTIGCAPSDDEISGMSNHYQASYWNGSTNDMHGNFVAQLLAAQAQDIPVDIFFDDSGCNTSSSYGFGGLGRKMHGISVNPE